MQNDPSTASIARLSGEFVCASTEIAFLHEQSRAILRHLRRALTVYSVFYLLFGITDVLALGLQEAAVPLACRLALALLAYAGVRYSARSATPVRAAYRVATLYTLAAMAAYMVVVWYRPDDVLVHGTAIGLMGVVILIFIPNRLPHAYLIAGVSSLVFILLVWCQHRASALNLASLTMLVLGTNGFAAMAANRHARLCRAQYRTQQVLTDLSIRDALTGCYNRRHLNAALLDGEFARARRYRFGLSLIMCDLDGFKAINDTHGHQAGDELLRSFAALLQAMTREAIDTVVRYGGEEFLIILPETHLDGAAELAERIRAAFAARHIDYAGVMLGTTASFGVIGADFSVTQALTPQGLIAAADELMYAAKHAGRNRVMARDMTPVAGGVRAGWTAPYLHTKQG